MERLLPLWSSILFKYSSEKITYKLSDKIDWHDKTGLFRRVYRRPPMGRRDVELLARAKLAPLNKLSESLLVRAVPLNFAGL